MSMPAAQEQSQQPLQHEEKVFRMYERWTQLAIDDNRLLSERTNIFLVASSILFAAFVLLAAESRHLGIALPSIGILLCFLHWVNATGTFRSIHFCWTSLIMLEKDEPALQSFQKRDLAPHSARWYYWVRKGEQRETEQERRQRSLEPDLPPPPEACLVGRPIKNSWFSKVGPATISVTFIPLAFFILWTIGAVVAGFGWWN